MFFLFGGHFGIVENMKRVVTIGGGSGHAQILKGLRRLSGVTITAICPSTDSGGSTGQLMRDYGSKGYLGDVTKCIAALCPNRRMSRTLSYRFIGGDLDGHSLKNIILLGLEKTHRAEAALEAMHQMMGIERHRVTPVSLESAELRARFKYGKEIGGETNIDLIAQNPLWHPETHEITRILLKPRVTIAPMAATAVQEADWLVICPGDLYSSILPVLLPDGMRRAIKASSARIAIILNIMTKKGETQGYRAEDFITSIEKYLGRKCDVVIANNAPVPRSSRLAYALERKVQLSPTTLRRDRRVRGLPLVKVSINGEIFHDERAVTRALAEFFR